MATNNQGHQENAKKITISNKGTAQDYAVTLTPEHPVCVSRG